jgi:hypothetical protein
MPSARIFGLFFHLKTGGLAEKSKFENFGTIFEKNKLILREAVWTQVLKKFAVFCYLENLGFCFNP